MSGERDDTDEGGTDQPPEASENPGGDEEHGEPGGGGPEPGQGQPQPGNGPQGGPQGQPGGQPQAQGGPQGQGQPPGGPGPQGAQGGPQGGYQQGGRRQPVQTGPSVGDIFSRPDTKEEIVSGVVLYAMLGVGLFVAAFLIPLAANVFTMSFMLFGALALGPLLAVILADRQDEALESVPDTLVYATSAVTALGGTVAYGIIAAIGGAIGDSIGSGGGAGLVSAGFSPGDYIIGAILVAIAGAVAAAGLVALNRTVLAENPAPQGQPHQPVQGQGGGTQPPQQGGQR